MVTTNCDILNATLQESDRSFMAPVCAGSLLSAWPVKQVRVASVPAAVLSFFLKPWVWVRTAVRRLNPDAISRPCLQIAQWFPVVDSV